MKPSFLRILLFVLAVVVGLIWTRSGNFDTPITQNSASSAPSARSQHAAVATATSPASPDRDPISPRLSEEQREFIHRELRKWAQVQTGDDAAHRRIADELGTLLTDANAGDIVQALNADERDSPFGLLALDRWVQTSPKNALEWISARSTLSDGEVFTVAHRLGTIPEQLAIFCSQLPNTPWRQSMLSQAGLEAIPTSDTLALGLAAKMDAGPAQTNLYETAAYDWMSRDPTAASHWITTVTDPALREKLLAMAAKALAVTDPDLAAGWLTNSMRTDGAIAESALYVVQNWATRDPIAASSWVDHLPLGKSRQSAIDVVLAEWSNTDAAAAHAWLQKLPERAEVSARLQAEADRRNTPVADP